jgi:methyl-accepting chemotaxis protein
LIRAIGHIQSGRYDIELPQATRQDEIGEMARALEVFKGAEIEKIRMAKAREAERLAREEADRQAAAARGLRRSRGKRRAGSPSKRLSKPKGRWWSPPSAPGAPISPHTI